MGITRNLPLELVSMSFEHPLAYKNVTCVCSPYYKYDGCSCNQYDAFSRPFDDSFVNPRDLVNKAVIIHSDGTVEEIQVEEKTLIYECLFFNLNHLQFNLQEMEL
ncbi:hypothetical protein [Bacillus mycoides]|uniref:hypothetical protein n=1 Tax=Bacillus mycoides TaxID=1405 RepID=UPI0010BE4832|nr:hypothetical protein [Bacillus mycoides]TKI27727.1 hypothetical protein FC700_29905 [Bacillus mycoides]